MKAICEGNINKLIIGQLNVNYLKNTDMWTHPHCAGVTRISRISPAWKLQLHFTRNTDVSPAFCNCQVKQYPSPPKKKTHQKKQKKALFKEKKEPGKTHLYQRSLGHFITLCMTSVYFHFFSFCLSSLLYYSL